MERLIDYLYMDGYWPFVWGAYGIAAAVLIGLLIASLRMVRANERAAASMEESRSHRRRNAARTPDTPSPPGPASSGDDA